MTCGWNRVDASGRVLGMRREIGFGESEWKGGTDFIDKGDCGTHTCRYFGRSIERFWEEGVEVVVCPDKSVLQEDLMDVVDVSAIEIIRMGGRFLAGRESIVPVLEVIDESIRVGLKVL
jgi:hypothetical protein